MVWRATVWVLKNCLEKVWNRCAVFFLNRMLLNVFDEFILDLQLPQIFAVLLGFFGSLPQNRDSKIR